MALPPPEPGLVISYAYLWRHEQEAGLEEGRKARPCVIILAVEQKDEQTLVTVVPVTHRPPDSTQSAVEIPIQVKRHLGLDDAASWVMVDEVNQFVWPGFDLQPVPGATHRYAYGFLPPRLFDSIKTKVLDVIISRRARITNRE